MPVISPKICVFWLYSATTGAPLAGETPVFATYKDTDGDDMSQPAIDDIGGGAYGFLPAFDSGKGIVDTACARTVAGGEWFEDYKRLLRLSDLETEIRPFTVNETFRFGDGRRVPCDTAYEIPHGHREHPHEGGSVRHPELAALTLARPRLLQDLHAGHPLEVSTIATM